ncbi:MAG: electron transport complex subunit E [Clostridia bacterium]|nr:electron transport complex subunit E [Clostridia bacterium]
MKHKISTLCRDGLLDNNPVFIQLLGICSTLAVTTSLSNGIGMGLAMTLILVCSNVFISLLRKFIPNEARIAAFIVVISTFVTVVDLLLKAYIPALSESLGLFIPLIVVNCIILARAEAFASQNGVLDSLFDGLFMGLGYTLALVLISALREILGNGSIYGIRILPENVPAVAFFQTPAGAFIALGLMTALMRTVILKLKARKAPKVKH